jgi:hypothetical protein
MSESEMNTSEPNMVGYFGKHMVGIGATQFHGDPPVQNFFFIVGFLASIKGEWFFVTAGHCLAELEEAISSSKVENFRLVDYVGQQAKNEWSIPFDYNGSFRDFHHDERSGVDAGFVHLQQFYSRQLATNEVVAHDEVQWKRQPKRFETASMMGIPASTVKRRDAESYWFSTDMIPLEILNSPPQKFNDDSPCDLTDLERSLRDGLFYAKFPDDIALPKNDQGDDDIKGMSGGPIFGFAHSLGKLKYWIAAVQSSWYPQSRLIRGTPFPLIADSIEKYLNDLVDLMRSSEEHDTGGLPSS